MSETDYNDTDIIDLIAILWAEKFFIIFGTALFGIFAGAYMLLVPTKYEGVLAIRPLDTPAMAQYAALNEIPGLSPPLYEENVYLGLTGIVVKEDLLEEFVDALQGQGALSRAIAQHHPKMQGFEGSDYDRRDKMRRIMRNFDLTVPPKQSPLDEDVKLTYVVPTRELGDKILTQAFTEIFARQRNAYLNAVENKKRAAIEKIQYKDADPFTKKTIAGTKQQMEARITAALATTPLATDSFKSVNADIGGVFYRPKIRPALTLFIGLMLGGVLSCGFVLIRHAIRARAMA